ncbi:MAG: NAD-dependent epimerase/dehydratase family protein [Phycisphaerales bacterium]
MNMSRRDFVQFAAAAGLAIGTAPAWGLVRPRAALRILILGGTGFLGPACTEAAIARGHHVTHFNRGRLESKRKEAGRPSVVPDGVEILYGNRDPEKNADEWKSPADGERDPDSPKGLSQLEGKTWDAVIDTSGYVPRIVKASAELLAKSVGFYAFISTVSVYARNDAPDADETAELGKMGDPTVEDMGADMSNYGPLKALCEAEAEKAMPGRVANVRPGFIVGARDTSGRFVYWPRRIAEGGEVLVPGTQDDPVQFIDVRDLAEFTVHLIEQKTAGVFNATGPATKLRMADMVAQCKAGVGGDATFTWVDPELLQSKSIGLPIWIPPQGEYIGFHTRSIKRALDAGLKFRPVSDTAKATLDWYNSLPADLRQRVGAHVLPKEVEVELLAAHKAAKPADNPR